MKPFQRVLPQPWEIMIKREVLMEQPCEMFAPFFGGRAPSLQEKLHWIEVTLQRITSFNTYQNDVYVVRIRNAPPFIHLDISRIDERPCKSWKDFQQIKNELVGPEHEALELYPAESRLVDTANQYHLWVYAEPGKRFELGFQDRFVLQKPIRMEEWLPDSLRQQSSDGRQMALDGTVETAEQRSRKGVQPGTV